MPPAITHPIRQQGDNIYRFLKESAESGYMVRVRDVTITTAQLLVLNATIQTIVPAPGADKFLLFRGAIFHKPAGTAYADVAGGDDLAIKYTDASGLAVAEVEATGFLDQTTAQTRYAHPYIATGVTADSSITPVANAVLTLGMLNGEVTTGDSDLIIRIFYSVMTNILS